MLINTIAPLESTEIIFSGRFHCMHRKIIISVQSDSEKCHMQLVREDRSRVEGFKNPPTQISYK